MFGDFLTQIGFVHRPLQGRHGGNFGRGHLDIWGEHAVVGIRARIHSGQSSQQGQGARF
jgi:hypothetical protein